MFYKPRHIVTPPFNSLLRTSKFLSEWELTDWPETNSPCTLWTASFIGVLVRASEQWVTVPFSMAVWQNSYHTSSNSWWSSTINKCVKPSKPGSSLAVQCVRHLNICFCVFLTGKPCWFSEADRMARFQSALFWGPSLQRLGSESFSFVFASTSVYGFWCHTTCIPSASNCCCSLSGQICSCSTNI